MESMQGDIPTCTCVGCLLSAVLIAVVALVSPSIVRLFQQYGREVAAGCVLLVLLAIVLPPKKKL